MSYTPISIDRENLTILGVSFPDLATFNSAVNAIGSNMFEGFMPTPKIIQIFRNYLTGELSLQQFMQIARDKAYE